MPVKVATQELVDQCCAEIKGAIVALETAVSDDVAALTDLVAGAQGTTITTPNGDVLPTLRTVVLDRIAGTGTAEGIKSLPMTSVFMIPSLWVGLPSDRFRIILNGVRLNRTTDNAVTATTITLTDPIDDDDDLKFRGYAA